MVLILKRYQVLISLYAKSRDKGGAFIWKIPKLALRHLFSRVALIKLFLVRVWCLVKKWHLIDHL